MLENIFGTSTRRVNVDQMEPIELEEGYDGPHITFPLTIDQVNMSTCGGVWPVTCGLWADPLIDLYVLNR
jgi:hypothetical protein